MFNCVILYKLENKHLLTYLLTYLSAFMSSHDNDRLEIMISCY